MQINPTIPVLPPPPADRQTAASYGKTAEAELRRAPVTEPKVFTPAPPLRPNIQDYVDINRTLLALRKL